MFIKLFQVRGHQHMQPSCNSAGLPFDPCDDSGLDLTNAEINASSKVKLPYG